MKKIIIVIVVLFCIGWLATCSYRKAMDTPSQETIVDSLDENDEYEYHDQAELNELHGNLYLEYNDSIEQEFQMLLSALPQYKDEFNKEKDAWGKYQNAVRAVADCEDHGSSTSMFIDDVLSQGIVLRETSFRGLFIQTQGKSASFSKTVFTSDMIADAYSAFIRAVGEDEYQERKSEYQESLRKEQKCWNQWMECRKQVSQKLADNIRSVYDKCTNQTMRTKLLQLKNQNQALGMTGHEAMECVLPDDCSDKALLEYPGFDKVWAKHCENTDWYPTFD